MTDSEAISTAEINQIFNLTKRKTGLKLYEQRILANNPTLRNSNDENLLHNYIKLNNTNLSLIKRMVKNKYDVQNTNKQGNSIIDSFLANCTLDSDDKLQLFEYMVSNNFKMSNDKLDITHGIFKKLINYVNKANIICFYNYDRYSRTRNFVSTGNSPVNPHMCINSHFFNALKKLHSKKMLETDLTCGDYKCFNPGNHCITLDMVKWFDKNFKINWDLDTNVNFQFIEKIKNMLSSINGYYSYNSACSFISNNPVHNQFSSVNKEYVEWLIKKNPKYAYKAQHFLLLEKALSKNKIEDYQFYLKVKIDKFLKKDDPSYSDGCDGGDDVSDEAQEAKCRIYEKYVWQRWVKQLTINYENFSDKMKLIIIYAILKKDLDIEWLDLGYVRKLNLTISDLKNDVVLDKTKMTPTLKPASGYYNSKFTTFPSNPNISFHPNEKTINNVRPMTKNECIITVKLIKKHIANLSE